MNLVRANNMDYVRSMNPVWLINCTKAVQFQQIGARIQDYVFRYTTCSGYDGMPIFTRSRDCIIYLVHNNVSEPKLWSP